MTTQKTPRPIIVARNVDKHFGTFRALKGTNATFYEGQVTAIIGPSGSGKSTFLRTLNRLETHDGGSIHIDGIELNDDMKNLDAIRREVGMVFQKPNPFPKSVYDNVAYGPRLHGSTADLDVLVERSLIRAGLWDEVKDDLGRPATTLSGGQQQRLVIARCLAVDPEVILMDEPTASLDPVATATIEELTRELSAIYTIVLVTHDLRQAARISDRTAFFAAHAHDDDTRHGELVEYGPTAEIFDSPADERTREYVTGGRD